MAALRSRCGHYIFALWFLSFFLFSSSNLSGCRLHVCHTFTHNVALVPIFWMHVWNVLHVARWKYRTQKWRKKIATWTPSDNFVGLYLHNKGMYRQSQKNLLNSNISPTCPYNIGCKKVAKNRHLGTIAQICRAISLQLRHVSIIGKKTLAAICPPDIFAVWFLSSIFFLASPVWNVLHAARWKYRTQKNRRVRTIAQLCRAISSQLRHVSTIGKKTC